MSTKSSLWEKGQSGNRSGRPPKEKVGAKPVSPLRKTLAKLRELEPKALENISKVVNGTYVKSEENDDEVDKQMLETSKWVISTISSLSRAAISDEELRHNIRVRAEEKAEKEKDVPEDEVQEKSNVVRFSMKMKQEDDEE